MLQKTKDKLAEVLENKRIADVSRDSGISYIFIWRIAKNKTVNPNLANLERLNKYLGIN